MSKLLNGIIALLSFIWMYQCATSKQNTSMSHKRNIRIAQEDALNAQFYFYKQTDTSITLYTLINAEPLLSARLDTGLQFYAAVKINVYLHSISKNTVSDSAQRIFYFSKTMNSQKYFAQMNMHTFPDNYHARIHIIDLNKRTQYTYYTEIKMKDDYTRHNFLVTYHDSLLFKPYALHHSQLKIYHRKKYPKLYVDVFHYNYTPAPPPFSNFSPSFTYVPDSSFTIDIQPDGYYLLNISSHGYYHIKAFPNELDGLTIFSIDSVFPNIKDSREMLYTTRYIMNKNEFELCNKLKDITETKKCIDNFWIQIAGSKERAKEIIRNYYQRVIEANRLFTSYKYGWQTDRGMIYIIFGMPEDIQKSMHVERWYYSINGQKNALVFKFIKNEKNPFTSSDFILERSDYYKDIWYLTVDKIRQGRLSTHQ